MSSRELLRPASGYYSEQIESETVLFSPTRQLAMSLDSLATLVWKMCDGSRTEHDIVRELSEIYADQADCVARDVAATIEKLKKEGAIIATLA